jgi:hypothetical protein
MAPTCRRIGSNLSNMSVRVVARIRPLLKSESEVDTIITTAGADEKARPNVVKVPNPKNFSEQFSFQFNSVYGEDTTQQEIFDAEGELGLPLELAMVLKMRCSCAHRQASVSWVRCHPLRLWSYLDRKDTHYARRQVAHRPRHYSSTTK